MHARLGGAPARPPPRALAAACSARHAPRRPTDSTLSVAATDRCASSVRAVRIHSHHPPSPAPHLPRTYPLQPPNPPPRRPRLTPRRSRAPRTRASENPARTPPPPPAAPPPPRGPPAPARGAGSGVGGVGVQKNGKGSADTNGCPQRAVRPCPGGPGGRSRTFTKSFSGFPCASCTSKHSCAAERRRKRRRQAPPPLAHPPPPRAPQPQTARKKKRRIGAAGRSKAPARLHRPVQELGDGLEVRLAQAAARHGGRADAHAAGAHGGGVAEDAVLVQGDVRQVAHLLHLSDE